MADPGTVAGVVGKAVVPAAKAGPAGVSKLRAPGVLLALQEPKSPDNEVLVRVENLYPATLNVRLLVVLTTRTFTIPPQRTVRPSGSALIVIDTGTRDSDGEKSRRRGKHFECEMWVRKPGAPTALGERFTRDYCVAFSLTMDTSWAGQETRWTISTTEVTHGDAMARGQELLGLW